MNFATVEQVTCVDRQLHYTRVLPRVVTNAVLLRCMLLAMILWPPPQQYPGVDGVPEGSLKKQNQVGGHKTMLFFTFMGGGSNP